LRITGKFTQKVTPRQGCGSAVIKNGGGVHVVWCERHTMLNGLRPNNILIFCILQFFIAYGEALRSASSIVEARQNINPWP
jgi:hypothetical protein